MSDRLQEIRARLEVALDYSVQWPDHKPGTLAEFIAHAPADIAWLLGEVERLRNTKASSPNPLCDESVVQDVTKLECSDG